MSKQSFIQTYLTESERAIFYPKQILDENGLCICESCLDCNSSRFRKMKKPRQCVCCQCYNLRDIKIENDKIYCLDCYGLGLDEINIDDYICQICGELEYDEVGLSTGKNGVEKRVCNYCDIDGCNYNGWGDCDEKEDLDEEIECPTCNQSITRGQLIEQDERFCENCWEPEDDEYCCCCRNPEQGLDGGCLCRCHDEEGGEYIISDDEDDNRECCEMCGEKTSNDEWTDYLGNDILYCDDCYDEHRVRIEQKCTECNFRQSSLDSDLCKICDENEIDEEEQRFIDAWKNDDFETWKEMFINKKNACKNRDEIDPEEDYESANCETCGENYLLDKLEVEDDKFYCRLCVV
jgi:hypothetical protein